jgi:DNA primase
MAAEQERVRVVDFYTEVVLPALEQRLDQAFPEFGWRRDARGWVATNEEHTHARLGVRAERVVAHGPAPRGFLVHGGDPMLWTAYLSGGATPHGADFVHVVADIASRAGVDTAPIERATPRDRRAELLEEFFELARRELSSERGAPAHAYLERRGFPLDQIQRSGLGLVPSPEATHQALSRGGFPDAEIRAAGILADSRWPGRLCGAWRNEWGKIGTVWTRALDDREAAETRYLYLRGASRTDLPPYGLARGLRELVLVEGFFDYHQLQARGVENIAALGGTSTSSSLFERLSQLGLQEVTMCLDNDDAGRSATARAVEHSTRAHRSPAIYVVASDRADAKDPDALIRQDGVDAWRALLDHRECGIVWRAAEMVSSVSAIAPLSQRREALGRAGAWLGSLAPRLALEQEDAVQVVAERCGYSNESVQRAFRARFFRDGLMARDQPLAPEHLARRVESGVDL